MRNLKLFKTITRSFTLNEKDVVNFSIDENRNYLFILFVDGTVVKADLNDKEIVFDNFHISRKPVNVTYLSSFGIPELCIIDSESITTFDFELNKSSELAIEGECIASEWSPGQDLLTVCTEAGFVKLYSYADIGLFIILNEIKLEDHQYINQFINVGWGSKETQFHGSEGKAARKTITVDDLGLVESSSNTYCITWCGDGSHFAVSFSRESHNAFLVIDKHGIPRYSSEICSGLESIISWRPSGNLIAGAQCLPNKYQIVFFEKNGLRHGEFVLHKKINLKKLSWSSDSEVLLILYDEKNVSHVELWTTSNYHWYLKQSLIFNIHATLNWDTGLDFLHRSGKFLHVLSANNYITYEWIWAINHSNGCDETDSACVGVIDGCNLLVTNFKQVSIPPPMASVILKHDRYVNFVIFGPHMFPNDITVVLDDYSLIRYNCVIEDSITYKQSKMLAIGLFGKSLPLILSHWLWVDKNIYICYNNVDKKLIKLTVTESEQVKLSECKFNKSIVNMEHWPTKNSILLQNESGDLLKYDIENESADVILPSLNIFNKLGSCEIDKIVTIFGLNILNRFFIDGIEVANNVSSYFLHSDFLLLTTLQHTLLCVKLDRNVIDSLKKNKTLSEIFMRKIERGARLVTVVQCDKKTVLQMPRGNLETIYPRAMSIQIVASLIDSKNYKEAFNIMKVERINLNLLYDHDPLRFIENVKEFVEDIGNPTHLNMFLLELNDEDVTKTMYSKCYNRDNVSNDLKRQLITDAVLKVLCENSNSDKYLLSIVTAYIVRHTQTDLEKALRKIQEAKRKESNGDQLEVSSDKALGHILLLVNINDLYNIALGLYDFELLMMVAIKSQKDPKEYIPFLNDLNKMDSNYRKFMIDKYLKKYHSALKWLSKCEDRFEECLEFIKTHSLHKEALTIFTKNDKNYPSVCEVFGIFLSEKHCYNEAAIMFIRSGNLERALLEFKKSLNWSECIITAMKLQYEERRLQILLRTLVDDLIAQRKYKEASIILNEHLNDYEEAISVLSEGRFWDDVLRLIYINSRMDIVETHLKPGIIKHADCIREQISKNSEQFLQQCNRLKLIRSESKLKSQIEFSNEAQVVENDLYSDTASVITQSTIASKSSTSSFRSFRSSKNRRKHERKMLSLKEGSMYEDVALIRSLHQLITNTAALRVELCVLSNMLLRFDYDSTAKDLQKSIDQLLKSMKEAENEIWNQDVVQKKVNTFGPHLTSNNAVESLKNDNLNELKFSQLEPQYRYPPDISTIHWKLFMLD